MGKSALSDVTKGILRFFFCPLAVTLKGFGKALLLLFLAGSFKHGAQTLEDDALGVDEWAGSAHLRANHVEGLLGVDAGDLQRLRARHVAEQPARLRRHTQHNTTQCCSVTGHAHFAFAATALAEEEEEEEEGDEEEDQDKEKEKDEEEQE